MRRGLLTSADKQDILSKLHITRCENIDKMKTLIFDTTTNKTREWKSPSIFEGEKIVIECEKLSFMKEIVFQRNILKFQPINALVSLTMDAADFLISKCLTSKSLSLLFLRIYMVYIIQLYSFDQLPATHSSYPVSSSFILNFNLFQHKQKYNYVLFANRIIFDFDFT